METIKSLEKQLQQDAKESGNVELSIYEYVEEYAINDNNLGELFSHYTNALLLYILDEAAYYRAEEERAEIARKIISSIIDDVLVYRLRVAKR